MVRRDGIEMEIDIVEPGLLEIRTKRHAIIFCGKWIDEWLYIPETRGKYSTGWVMMPKLDKPYFYLDVEKKDNK